MTVSNNELTDFSHSVGNLMLQGDRSFIQCLTTAAEGQSNRRFKRVMKPVIADVARGYPLSVAMARYPASFSPEYISAVRQGEKNGTLETALLALDFSTNAGGQDQ